MSPKISLVVASANMRYFAAFLQSLSFFTSYPYELIVIFDNTQTSDPVDVEVFKPVLQYPNSTKMLNLGPGFHGVGHNWNLGIQEATGDYIGILNDDILFSSGWLGRLAKFMECCPEYGAVSPIWHWTGVPDIDMEKTPVDQLWSDLRPWNSAFSEQAVSYGDTHDDINYGLQGCFFFLKREALEKMADTEQGTEPHPGLFDETTFPGGNWEDTDIAMRLNRAGYDMAITHSVALHHFGSQTVARQDVRAQLGDFYKDGLPKFYKKWGLDHLIGQQFMVHNSILSINGQNYPSK